MACVASTSCWTCLKVRSRDRLATASRAPRRLDRPLSSPSHLAELDEYLACYLDDDPAACEREINDRQELSEALLSQGEMLERELSNRDGRAGGSGNWGNLAP